MELSREQERDRKRMGERENEERKEGRVERSDHVVVEWSDIPLKT